jgi:hypothetical protein
MVKACILAFVSGIFFFFLILQSAWWLIPAALTWTAIFVWQDRQDTRAKAKGTSVPEGTEGYDRGVAECNERHERGGARNEAPTKF